MILAKPVFVFVLVASLLVSVSILSVAREPEPKFLCNNPSFHFGALANTNAVRHSFVLENHGDAPLLISKVRACCGATAKLENKTIDPGKSTTLDVILNIRGKQGKVNKTIYLHTNDSAKRIHSVKITGEAVSVRVSSPIPPPSTKVHAQNDVFLIKPSEIDFKEIPVDAKLKTEIDVSLHGLPLGVHVTNVVCDVPEIGLRMRSESNRVQVIEIYTKPPLKLGQLVGEISLFTNSRLSPVLIVPVLGLVQTDLYTYPKKLVLLDGGKGLNGVQRFFSVRSRSGRQFKILDVKCPAPSVEAQLMNLPSEEGHVVRVRNLTASDEIINKGFLIVTDQSDCKEIRLPILLVSTNSASRLIKRTQVNIERDAD